MREVEPDVTTAPLCTAADRSRFRAVSILGCCEHLGAQQQSGSPAARIQRETTAARAADARAGRGPFVVVGTSTRPTCDAKLVS